jgi:hypothetical protein
MTDSAEQLDIPSLLALPPHVSPNAVIVSSWGNAVVDELARLGGLLTPTAWTALPLLNGWVAAGGNMQTPRYRKIGDLVYLEGLVKSGSLALPAANLPVGFRPPKQIQRPLYSGPTVSGGAVTTTGDFYIQFGDINGGVDIGSVIFSTV